MSVGTGSLRAVHEDLHVRVLVHGGAFGREAERGRARGRLRAVRGPRRLGRQLTGEGAGRGRRRARSGCVKKNTPAATTRRSRRSTRAGAGAGRGRSCVAPPRVRRGASSFFSARCAADRAPARRVAGAGRCGRRGLRLGVPRDPSGSTVLRDVLGRRPAVVPRSGSPCPGAVPRTVWGLRRFFAMALVPSSARLEGRAAPRAPRPVRAADPNGGAAYEEREAERRREVHVRARLHVVPGDQRHLGARREASPPRPGRGSRTGRRSRGCRPRRGPRRTRRILSSSLPDASGAYQTIAAPCSSEWITRSIGGGVS